MEALAKNEAWMMFERMEERARRWAERRAGMKAVEIADRMRAELPRGIEAEAVDGGIRLSGIGLKRRFTLEAALRWMRLS